MIKSFRISDDFDDKLLYVQKYLKNEMGLKLSIAQILDDMLELYYARIIMKSNILDELFREELRNNLQIYLSENAKMNNYILEKNECYYKNIMNLIKEYK